MFVTGCVLFWLAWLKPRKADPGDDQETPDGSGGSPGRIREGLVNREGATAHLRRYRFGENLDRAIDNAGDLTLEDGEIE
jgi:hypothetical protein